MNGKEVKKLTDIKEKVEPVIEKIRDGTVKVRLVGACAGCAMSQQTLKLGVERLLIKEVPEVKCVEQV